MQFSLSIKGILKLEENSKLYVHSRRDIIDNPVDASQEVFTGLRDSRACHDMAMVSLDLV